MMNYQTAPRGPKAPVRSRSSRENESNLHDLESPDYDVDRDLDDLKEVGGQYRKLQIKAFDYLVNTPIRAEANGEFDTLLARMRKNVGMDQRKDQTIYHLLARVYLGFTNTATISMWARAAEFTVAHLSADETVPQFLKRMGGIRACADAAREEGNEESDDGEQEESVSSKKRKPKLDLKARARMRREATEEHSERRRSSRSMPPTSGTSNRKKSEEAFASGHLDKEYFKDDDEYILKAELSEDACETFQLAPDGKEGLAHVIRRGEVLKVKAIVWKDRTEEIIRKYR